jgi:coproporphyrinogen III oxidase
MKNMDEASRCSVSSGAVRRGRYAEFNLIYDSGKLFGLKPAATLRRS